MDAGDVKVDSLRQQFQQLQEQQQKKLLLRKQKLSASSSCKSYDESKTATTSTDDNGLLGSNIHDDLELNLDNDFQEHLPSRSPRYDDTTRELKDENGRLYKLLAERDEEMRILRRQMKQEKQNLVGSGLAADAAASRIMELSKKNRDLASDIEKERRKVRQLTKELGEMRQHNSHLSQEMSAKNDKNVDKNNEEERTNVQNLKEKLKQALSKVADYRNQCEMLKKEARLAQKVITKECGENINIAAILNEPSGWRGRQQQITTLQNKVNELKQQLNEVSKANISTNKITTSISTNPQRISTPNLHEEKHKRMLRTMEKNKKENFEKVSDELQLLTEQHSKLQTKFDAAKTRNKILTNDLKSLKDQTKMLIEKGAHDDELIAALMREQERLQKSLEKKNSQIQSTEKNKPQKERSQQDNELVSTLTQLCKEREEKVAKLEQELKSMVMDAYQSQFQSKNDTELLDKSTNTDDFTTIDDTNHNHRAVEEEYPISSADNFKTSNPARRRRIVKPSGGKTSASPLPPTPPGSGSRRLKNSSTSRGGNNYEEYQTLYEAVTVERDKLLELVTVLQQREKDAQEYACNLSSDVKSLQRKTVEMEKKLARASANHQNTKTSKRQENVKNKFIGNEDPSNDVYFIDELRTELEIQKDENNALKETLHSTLQGKKEDFNFYQNIVEQTKQVFLQGLNNYRKTSSPAVR